MSVLGATKRREAIIQSVVKVGGIDRPTDPVSPVNPLAQIDCAAARTAERKSVRACADRRTARWTLGQGGGPLNREEQFLGTCQPRTGGRQCQPPRPFIDVIDFDVQHVLAERFSGQPLRPFDDDDRVVSKALAAGRTVESDRHRIGRAGNAVRVNVHNHRLIAGRVVFVHHHKGGTAYLPICDAQSLGPGDLVATDLVYSDRVGEVYGAAYDARQRWHYFPDMERSEVILIKGYDSETDGRARFAPHTAFDDPTSPPDAAPRESIEIRTFAFF